MKRRISKRIIAIGMSLCVAFSIMPLPVSAEAETAAPAVKQNNLWVSTGKTFVNRIYTVGLTTCGSALVRIAGATESEGFQKVASFVNKWICGGNNTGQTLAEIQALCNEILNEVKIVDQHLKGYYCRWNVWNRYILELLLTWWFPCNVFHGRVLHDSKILCKITSEAQNSCKCFDPDRYSDNACSVRRKKDACMDQ